MSRAHYTARTWREHCPTAERPPSGSRVAPRHGDLLTTANGQPYRATLRPRRAPHLSTPTTPSGAAPEPCPQDFSRRNTVGFGQLTTRPNFPEEATGPPADPDPWEEHFGTAGARQTARPFWTSATPSRLGLQPFTPATPSLDPPSLSPFWTLQHLQRAAPDPLLERAREHLEEHGTTGSASGAEMPSSQSLPYSTPCSTPESQCDWGPH